VFNFSRTPLTLAILSTCIATHAYASDELIEDDIEVIEVHGKLTNYSATKSDTPIMDVARSVSIEDLSQIIEKGALDLDDTFTYSAGVAGQTYGFATRGDWIKVRGLSVPQYRDSLQSLFGNYNNTRPDVFTLEQVEILKGPASVLYGKGSPGGLVNTVSKTPKTEAAHQIVVEAGNFDRKQIAIDSTGTIGSNEDWLYRLVSVVRDSDTQVNYVEDDSFVFAPSITWLANDQTKVTMLVNYTDTKSDTGAQFLPLQGTLLPAPNGETIASDTYLGLPDFNKYNAETFAFTVMAEHDINDYWQLSANARYTDASADYQQAWSAFLGAGNRYIYNTDGTLYKDGTVPRTFYRKDATSEQKAIDLRLLGEFSTGDIDHKVLIGTQYQRVTTGSAGYYAAAPGLDYATGLPDAIFGDSLWVNLFAPQYVDVDVDALLAPYYTVSPETKSTDIGIYVSDQIDIDSWSITLGARYDDSKSETLGSSQKDSEVSLSAGIIYKFNNGLSPYINYAESFEPVIGDDGQGGLLKAQRGEQIELGVKYVPTAFEGFFTLAWFDIEQTNLSDPSGTPNLYEQQSGKAKIQGVEFESLSVFGNFSLEVNASKLNTENAEGFKLDSVPETQASAWLGYKASGKLEGLKSGFGIRYNGESYDGTDTYRTPSYTLADFMIGYEVNQWDFALNLRNLTDKSYYATCLGRGDCFPGEERTIVGRVSYNF
jgi:iron complex outermembrane receptor protein